ncbi:hypothetical protein EWI61_10260 [Methylolobus aquaticus]|nr:hypothetical protein EWI61_10260 [Methylolobus aquaticus]
MTSPIPQTYPAWRHCIEVECGIPLTREFITRRLSVLRQATHAETARFIRHYGDEHWQLVVHWFETAEAEASA